MTTLNNNNYTTLIIGEILLYSTDLNVFILWLFKLPQITNVNDTINQCYTAIVKNKEFNNILQTINIFTKYMKYFITLIKSTIIALDI